jgi:hypothetical protein
VNDDDVDIRGALFDAEPPDLAFVRALATRTGAVVRRRAIRRRLAVVGAVVLAYAGGALTVVAASARTERAETPAAPAVAPPSPGAPRVPADRDALARAFRERGDRFLNEDGDVAAAIAAYRQHLELAGGAGAARAGPDDSWLLAALKHRTP